jgi:ADP-ribose pyrophosphatase
MSLEWKKDQQSIVRAGHRKILKKTFILPDGSRADYGIIDEGETCCVVAITTKNEVILVGQFRPGPEKYLLELPGGNVETNETPVEAITRELLEETGYQGDIIPINRTYGSAYSNRIRHNFLATGCIKIAEPNPEEREFIRLHLMSLNEFAEHIRSGNLTDVETGYAALDKLGLL